MSKTAKTTKGTRPNRLKINYGSRIHSCLVFAQVMRGRTFTPSDSWACFPKLKQDSYETRRTYRRLLELEMIREVEDEVYTILPRGQQLLQDVVRTRPTPSRPIDND